MITNLAPLILAIRNLDVFILWIVKIALTTLFVIPMLIAKTGQLPTTLKRNARKLFATSRKESVLQRPPAANVIFLNAKRTVNQRILAKLPSVLSKMKVHSVLELL